MTQHVDIAPFKTSDGRRFLIEVPAAKPLTTKWQLRARDALDTVSGKQKKALYWDDVIIRRSSQMRFNPFRVKWPSPHPLVLEQADLSGHCAVAEDTLNELFAAGKISSKQDVSAGFRFLASETPNTIGYTPDILRYTGHALSEVYEAVAPPRAPQRTCESLSVIVNYRDRPDLMIDCLKGIAAQRTTATVEIVLVNNQSSPENLSKIKDLAADLIDAPMLVKHIDYDKPFNKSAQDNLAAALSSGEVIVFFNNDAELLSENCLQVIADWALEPNVCCVGPRILGDHQRLVSNGVFARAANNSQAALIRENELEVFQHCIRPTVGISFACAAVSRESFEKVGNLDEAKFKSQYNDADFFIRALRLGMVHYHVGTVSCLHEPGASESRTKEKTIALLAEFRERYPEIGDYADIDFDAIKLKSIPKFDSEATAANRRMEFIRRWRKIQPHIQRTRDLAGRLSNFGRAKS